VRALHSAKSAKSAEVRALQSAEVRALHSASSAHGGVRWLDRYTNAPPSEPEEMRALQQRLLQRHTQLDMDPLANEQRKPWWLLYAGGSSPRHSARLTYQRRALPSQ
jgi:hypothetical protein